jgi:hypothetical protein
MAFKPEQKSQHQNPQAPQKDAQVEGKQAAPQKPDDRKEMPQPQANGKSGKMDSCSSKKGAC